MSETLLYGLGEKLENPILAPPDLVEFCEDIRRQWHADRLEGARIAYVLKPKSPTAGPHVELGNARGMNRILSLVGSVDFILTFYWDTWRKLSDAKRRALRLVREHHGFARNTVIAAGDGANDLAMLAEAGIGVAYHAKPVVRAQATHALSHAGLDGILHLFN